MDGWEKCVALILQAGLMVPSTREIEPVKYPDLDSDAGWAPTLVSAPVPPPDMVADLKELETLNKD